jgi:hypothetical protein
MIFLVDYDRPTGRTLLFKTFDHTERQKAHDERVRIERDRDCQGLLLTRREVVMLDARDEAALRRTNGVTSGNCRKTEIRPHSRVRSPPNPNTLEN